MQDSRLSDRSTFALGGHGELPDDWVTMATVIREPGREVFGVSSVRMIRRFGGLMRKYRGIFRGQGKQRRMTGYVYS